MPVEAVARHWTHLWGYSSEQTREQLRAFANRELLTLADDADDGFHDLQRDFLLLQTDDLALLHGELLAAYQPLLPERDTWSRATPQRALSHCASRLPSVRRRRPRRHGELCA